MFENGENHGFQAKNQQIKGIETARKGVLNCGVWDALPGRFRVLSVEEGGERNMNGNERQETSRRFTEDEMRTARETSLPDLLEHLGYQVRQLGNFYTTKEMEGGANRYGENLQNISDLS